MILITWQSIQAPRVEQFAGPFSVLYQRAEEDKVPGSVVVVCSQVSCLALVTNQNINSCKELA